MLGGQLMDGWTERQEGGRWQAAIWVHYEQDLLYKKKLNYMVGKVICFVHWADYME